MPEQRETRGASRYDAVIATLVGFCALCVSGYTAYMQRQQVRAVVWPILYFDSSNAPDIHFTLANKGVGLAIIRHVIVTVDHHPFDEEIHVAGHESVSPATILEHSEDAELIREAMDELPAECREILTLRHQEGLSYKEIADIAQIPPGTVMSRLARARAKLREYLAMPPSIIGPFPTLASATCRQSSNSSNYKRRIIDDGRGFVTGQGSS